MNAHNEQSSVVEKVAAEMREFYDAEMAPDDDVLKSWIDRLAAQPSPVVKQNLTTQPAAAQEAVAWFTDDHLSDKSATTYDPSVAERWRNKGWPVTALYAAPVIAATAWAEGYASGVIDERTSDANIGIAGFGAKVDPARANPYRFAAPVTAAPTLDDELAQDRMSELSKLERDILEALPSVYYMDPPDGGDVSLGEQVKRMAEDAALWRKHISTPAAPGIDLTPLWRLSDAWLKEPEGERQSPGENRLRWAMAKELRDALTLLDASPKGDDVTHRDLVPGVMRCAKCAFQLHRTNLYLGSGTTGPGDSKTEPCPNGCGPLWPVTWQTWATEGWQQAERYFEELRQLQDSPKGGSEAEVMQLRYQLNSLRQLLSGFDIAVQKNPLQPPCTYLEEVRLSHEFQPGCGHEVAAALRNALKLESEGAKQ